MATLLVLCIALLPVVFFGVVYFTARAERRAGDGGSDWVGIMLCGFLVLLVTQGILAIYLDSL